MYIPTYSPLISVSYLNLNPQLTEVEIVGILSCFFLLLTREWGKYVFTVSTDACIVTTSVLAQGKPINYVV